MYRYRYINKHYQFGQTNYTLILEDLENNYPIVRIDKTFNLDPNSIDDNILYIEASKEIIIATQNAINLQNTEEISTDDQGDS